MSETVTLTLPMLHSSALGQEADFALETSRPIQAEILVDVATSTVAVASQRHPLIGGLLSRS